MAVKYKEKCKRCFHFQVCANVLQNDLFIREVILGEKEPECKQFVEVVRCKDCKHWTTRDNAYGECIHRHWIIEGETNAVTSHDDFCSYGERKDNG